MQLTFTQKLDILHDILSDVARGSGRFWSPEDKWLISGKVKDLGDLVDESKGLLELSPLHRRLLWEVVTMVDVDTLNDNLTRVGFGDEDMDTSAEMDRLADLLDRDGAFQDEWRQLSRPDHP